MVDFTQLLDALYEAHGYLSEQDSEDAKDLTSQIEYLLKASGYADSITS